MFFFPVLGMTCLTKPFAIAMVTPGMAATAGAVSDWDNNLSGHAQEGIPAGGSDDTAVTHTTIATCASLSSSLPSAVAAAAMEREDEENVHRMAGRLKEAKKVGANLLARWSVRSFKICSTKKRVRTIRPCGGKACRNRCLC